MRILVFGDSITQGFCDEEKAGWCNRLIAEVMNKEVSDATYNKSVINLGISGDTTTDLLKRVKRETEARLVKYPTSDFDVALLAIGVNDTQYDMQTLEPKLSTEETRRNLESTVKILQELSCKVVFIACTTVYEPIIQPMAWKPTHGYSNKLILERNNLLREIALKNETPFIDVSGVYQGNEKDVLPDGIHPNAAGHKMIFEKVKSDLESLGIL